MLIIRRQSRHRGIDFRSLNSDVARLETLNNGGEEFERDGERDAPREQRKREGGGRARERF